METIENIYNVDKGGIVRQLYNAKTPTYLNHYKGIADENETANLRLPKIYKDIHEQAKQMNPDELGYIYDNASTKSMELFNYGLMKEKHPVLFNRIFSEKERAFSQQEILDLGDNKLYQTYKGITETVSSTYNRQRRGYTLFSEVFFDNISDNKINVDANTALMLEYRKTKINDYSEIDGVSWIQGSVFGFTDVMTQWAAPLATRLAGGAVGFFTGISAASTVGLVALPITTFTNSFVQEYAATAERLLYSEDADHVPLEIIKNAAFQSSFVNAAIEVGQMLMFQGAGKGVAGVAGKGAEEASEGVIKTWLSSFKNRWIRKLLDSKITGLSVEGVKLYAGETAQEVAQEFSANLSTRYAINFNDPTLTKALEEAVDETMIAVPKLAKSMFLMMFMPFARGGARNIINLNNKKKGILDKQNLDKDIDNQKGKNNVPKVQEMFSRLLKGTSKESLYIDVESLKNIDEKDQDAILKNVLNINNEDDKSTFFELHNTGYEVPVSQYVLLKSDDNLSKYSDLFSFHKRGIGEGSYSEHVQYYLNHVQDEKTDSDVFKEEFKAVRAGLTKGTFRIAGSKDVSFDKNIEKNKAQYGGIVDHILDYVALLKLSAKKRGTKYPKLKIKVIETKDQLQTLAVNELGEPRFDKFGEPIYVETRGVGGMLRLPKNKKVGKGNSAYFEKGTLYLNLPQIITNTSNDSGMVANSTNEADILSVIYHEISHALYTSSGTYFGNNNKVINELKTELRKMVTNKEFMARLEILAKESFPELKDKNKKERYKTYLTKLEEVFARAMEYSFIHKTLGKSKFLSTIFKRYNDFAMFDSKFLKKFFDQLSYYDNALFDNPKLEKILKEYVLGNDIGFHFESNNIVPMLSKEELLANDYSEKEVNAYLEAYETFEAKAKSDIAKEIVRNMKSSDSMQLRREFEHEYSGLRKKVRESKFFQAMSYISGREYFEDVRTGREAQKIYKDPETGKILKSDYKIRTDDIDFTTYKIPKRMHSENGIAIERVMKVFGIKDIDSFLSYVEQNYKNPFKKAEKQAKAIITAKYGSDFQKDFFSTNISLNKNARMSIKSYIGDIVTKMIGKEMNFIKKKVSKEDMKVMYKTEGMINVSVDASFDQTNMKNALNPDRYLDNVNEFSYKAKQAFKEKNYKQAYVNKIKQAYSYLMYIKSSMVVDRFNKFDSDAKNVLSNPDQFMKKYSSFTYHLLQKIYNSVGYQEHIYDAKYKEMSFQQFHDKYFSNLSTYDVFPISENRMNSISSIGELTTSEFTSLLEYIEFAKQTGDIFMSDIAETKDATYKQANSDYNTALDTLNEKSIIKNKVKRVVKKFIANNTKFSTIIKYLCNNDPTHPLMKWTINKEIEAQNTFILTSEKQAVKFKEIFDKLFKDKDYYKSLKEKVVIDLDTRKVDLTKEEILVMALNMGNEHNLSLLSKNHNYTMSELNKIRSFFSTEQMDVIQEVWNELDEMSKYIFDEIEKIDGVRPEGVAGNQFEFKGKDYRGGYFPIMWDAEGKKNLRLGQITDKNESVSDLKYSINMQQTTKSGNLQKRQEGTEHGFTLDLSLDKFAWAVQNIIKDYSWRRYLVNTKTLFLQSKKNYSKLNNKLGEFATQIVSDHIETIAGISYRDGFIDKMAYYLRVGVTTSTLGFSLGTGLVQLGGVVPSVSMIGLGNVMHGMSNMNNDFYLEKIRNSGIMKSRNRFINTELSDMGLKGHLNFFDKTRKAAFAHIIFTDSVISKISFIGAYNQFINDHFDPNKTDAQNEKLAVNYAEQVVSDSQGSGLDFTLSGIEASNSPLHKLFTMFMTFNNAALNAVFVSLRKNKSKARLNGESIRAISYYYVMLPLINNLVRLSWLGLAFGDKDEREQSKTRMIREFMASGVGFFPIINNIAYSWGSNSPYRAIPLDQLIDNFAHMGKAIGKLMGGEDLDMDGRWMEATADALGVATMLPLKRPTQWGRALFRYFDEPNYDIMDFFNKAASNINKK